MGWLSDLLRGGGDELGWDELVRQIADALAGLRRYGPRGEAAFPADAIVRITVPEGGAAVVRGFLARPELDREVVAALANRCDVPAEALPAREYVISIADRRSIAASEGAPRAWRVRIAGGDLDGAALELPAAWSELAFGRGPWHGADHGARNDLVVCERMEFVSRRAGRLYRAGHQLEVASLDQGAAPVGRGARARARRDRGRPPGRAGPVGRAGRGAADGGRRGRRPGRRGDGAAGPRRARARRARGRPAARARPRPRQVEEAPGPRRLSEARRRDHLNIGRVLDAGERGGAPRRGVTLEWRAWSIATSAARCSMAGTACSRRSARAGWAASTARSTSSSAASSPSR